MASFIKMEGTFIMSLLNEVVVIYRRPCQMMYIYSTGILIFSYEKDVNYVVTSIGQRNDLSR